MSENETKAPAEKTDEGNENVELPARRRRERHADEEGGGRRGLLLVLPLVMIGAGLAYTVLSGMGTGATYTKPLDEVVKNSAELARTQTKLRVAGTLVHGTLQMRESPCEYRFTLEANGVKLPVRFGECVVPDTFRDVPDMPVNAEVVGTILADNSFAASQVLAKCPSKYQGEKMRPNGDLSSLGAADNGNYK
jgi:cytochrome c-type biogenesis protein CcmE